jgi:site-specific DNA-methyltransferase (adenine-specific)
MTELLQVAAAYFEAVSAGYEVKIHPAADALPMLEDDAAASLLADVKAHGLRERIKIWIDQDRETMWLVDGRNRTRAAAAAGLYVRSVIEWKMFEDDAEVARFVFSLNLERRHLNSSQRAMAGARLLPMFEEAARERQGARSDLTSAPIGTEVRVHRADEEAADALNTSARSVARAKKVLTDAPELAPLVDAGQLPVSAAAKLAKEDEDTRARVAKKISSGEAKNAPQALKQVADDRRAERASEVVLEGARFEVVTGEAVDVLSASEAEIHCVITDPPYGLETHRTRQGGQDYADGEEYALGLLDEVCEALKPRLADGAHLYFFTGYTHLHAFKTTLARHFWVQDNPIVWIKPRHTLCDFTKKWPSACEYILFAKHGDTSARPLASCLKDWIGPYAPGTTTGHSAEKPVEVLRALVEQSSEVGELVVDPFTGSGSTGAAALSLGRRFFGAELDERWADVARVRLAEVEP